MSNSDWIISDPAVAGLNISIISSIGSLHFPFLRDFNVSVMSSSVHSGDLISFVVWCSRKAHVTLVSSTRVQRTVAPTAQRIERESRDKSESSGRQQAFAGEGIHCLSYHLQARSRKTDSKAFIAFIGPWTLSPRWRWTQYPLRSGSAGSRPGLGLFPSPWQRTSWRV